jgi:hypothetical protein
MALFGELGKKLKWVEQRREIIPPVVGKQRARIKREIRRYYEGCLCLFTSNLPQQANLPEETREAIRSTLNA